MVSHEEELRVTYERGRIAGSARVAALEAENADLRGRVAALESDDMIEALAALAHEQWAGWALWMIEQWDQRHPGGETYFDRWSRQIETPYDLLSDAEKENDRIEARKVLATIRIRAALPPPPAAEGGTP